MTIGIDIGGTWTRVGLVAPDGDVAAVRRFRTPRPLGEPDGGPAPEAGQADAPMPDAADAHLADLVGRIRAAIDALAKAPACDSTFRGVAATSRAAASAAGSRPVIGLALAGVMDARGAVLSSANLSWLGGRSVARALARATGRVVYPCTDIAAATWAEYQAWPEPVEAFAHLRIGTGVGFGLIRDGVWVELSRTGGGHLDVLRSRARQHQRACPCGRTGCLEVYLSDRFRHADSDSVDLPAVDSEGATSPGVMHDRRGLGDREGLAGALGPEAGAVWAEVLARLTEMIGPGGVLSMGGGRVLPVDVETLSSAARQPGGGCFDGRCPWRGVRGVPARLGDLAGVIGASWLARRRRVG